MKLTCPRCASENEHSVPTNEATTLQRDVRCRKCGHRFSYGFLPEYVTEAEPEHRGEARSEAPDHIDDPATAIAVRERLARHVARYTEYVDRDRDILLLHSMAMMERLDSELTSIKRMVDVIAKRTPSR